MPCVSITRLKLRHWWTVPAFLRAAGASASQLRDTPGFVDGYLAFNSGHVYWTVSLWASKKAMQSYRFADAHGEAMKKVPGWCSEAAVATLDLAVAAAPSPGEIVRLFEAHGRLSKVDKPTAAHEQGLVWPDRRVPSMGKRIIPL